MEREQEKEIIYNGLLKLTNDSEPNRYFSKKLILEYIKEGIELETDSHIHFRKGIILKYLGGSNFDSEKINLNETLPRQKTLGPNLEELTKEGKVQKVNTEWRYGRKVSFYRANIDYKPTL